MFTEQLTQALGFCAEVDPQVINNTSKTAGPIDMSKFKRACSWPTSASSPAAAASTSS